MEVIVDGIIYQLQARGGISRIFNEILPRMCQTDETLNLTLLMTGKSQQTLPYHPQIHTCYAPQIERFLKPDFVWRSFTNRLKEGWMKSAIKNTEDKIWHSTYYTMPKVWQGKTVVTVADMAYELFPHLFNTTRAEQFRGQKRRCVLSADAVICISESTRKDVLKLYEIDPDKVRAVLLGYGDTFKRLENPRSDIDLPLPVPFLLYVGTRSEYKNFEQLIQAYSLWQHRHEVNLVIVGPQWSSDEVENLTKSDIYDHVSLLNKVDDETLCYLYSTAAAFVYPSLYEGFGIPLLEAMACGCPVVASRIPSTVEVASDCPVYFDPKERDDLILALDKALSERRDSKRVLAGLERVKNFSWQKTAEETLEVYRSLASD